MERRMNTAGRKTGLFALQTKRDFCRTLKRQYMVYTAPAECSALLYDWRRVYRWPLLNSTFKFVQIQFL